MTTGASVTWQNIFLDLRKFFGFGKILGLRGIFYSWKLFMDLWIKPGLEIDFSVWQTFQKRFVQKISILNISSDLQNIFATSNKLNKRLQFPRNAHAKMSQLLLTVLADTRNFEMNFWPKSCLCFCRVWMKLVQGCEKIVPVSQSFWGDLKFLIIIDLCGCEGEVWEWVECHRYFPSAPFVVPDCRSICRARWWPASNATKT